MDRPDIDLIKQNLATGGYGTMCKACTDRMEELIGYIEEQEVSIPVETDTVTLAHIDGIVATIAPHVLAADYYRKATVRERARMAAKVVRGQQEEIGQIRAKSQPGDALFAATDSIVEVIERRANGIIDLLPEEEQPALRKRVDEFMKAWRTFLGMTSERAAFQSACQVVKSIRVKAIQLAVSFDDWQTLDGVAIKSNAAGHDFGLLVGVLAELGGQDSVNYCREYLRDNNR